MAQPTDDEQYLHGDVSDGGAPGLVHIADETHVVGHRHGHVEGGQQDQPIPARLEGAEVQEDEFGFLGIGDLVLGQRRGVPEHVLVGGEKDINNSKSRKTQEEQSPFHTWAETVSLKG